MSALLPIIRAPESNYLNRAEGQNTLRRLVGLGVYHTLPVASCRNEALTKRPAAEAYMASLLFQQITEHDLGMGPSQSRLPRLV